MSTPEAQYIAPPAFLTTRWTQVLSARGDSPQARAAMGELCEAYWMPVFRFVRRSGEMFLWLSDDARRIPVRARIKTSGATVIADLKSIK